MLIPNQCEEITFNIKTNESIKFVRVGVLGDGKCMLHSLLLLLNDAYMPGTIEQKTELCQKFIDELIHTFTIDKWVQTIMTEYVFDIISQLRSDLESKISSTDLDCIFENIPMSADTFNKFVYQIEFHIGNWLIKNSNEIAGECQNFVHTRVIQLCVQLYEEYKRQLHHMKHLGQHELRFISQNYKVNIILFDTHRNLFHDTIFSPDYEITIFLYNQGGVHWEPVMIQKDDKLYRHVSSKLVR